MPEIVGALPTGVDLILYAGDDFWIRVAVKDPSGSPVDLTTYTHKSQIRASAAATDILAEFVITVEANTSTLLLTLSSAKTAALPSNAVWDLQIIDTADVVTTLTAGRVRTVAEVTR